MPIIQRRSIKKTRKEHPCFDCCRTIQSGSPAVSLFGMAHEGEKPFWIYRHTMEACPEPSHYTKNEAKTGINTPLKG